MKKSLVSFSLALSIAAFGVVAFIPVVAQAQTTVACPAGYTCTPINPTQPVNCPAGYVCTPNTPVSTGGGSSGGGFNGGGNGYTGTKGNCYQFTTTLTIGSTGADVVALQNWLMTNGFDISAVSAGRTARGYFGSQTVTALQSYQTSVGLPATGVLDAITRRTITLSCGITSPTPVSSQVQISNTSASLGAAVTNSSGATSYYPVSFSFTLTAGNTSIYFIPAIVLEFGSKNGNVSPDKGGITVSPATLAGDSSNYYIIPAGSSRQLVFNGSISNAGASVNGINIAQIVGIDYGTSPSNPQGSWITSGLDNLKVSANFNGGGIDVPNLPSPS